MRIYSTDAPRLELPAWLLAEPLQYRAHSPGFRGCLVSSTCCRGSVGWEPGGDSTRESRSTPPPRSSDGDDVAGDNASCCLSRAPLLQSRFFYFLQWRLQGLALRTAAVFRSKEEFGCLLIFFFPSLPKKNTFKILVCYRKKRKMMLLETKPPVDMIQGAQRWLAAAGEGQVAR